MPPAEGLYLQATKPLDTESAWGNGKLQHGCLARKTTVVADEAVVEIGHEVFIEDATQVARIGEAHGVGRINHTLTLIHEVAVAFGRRKKHGSLGMIAVDAIGVDALRHVVVAHVLNAIEIEFALVFDKPLEHGPNPSRFFRGDNNLGRHVALWPQPYGVRHRGELPLLIIEVRHREPTKGKAHNGPPPTVGDGGTELASILGIEAGVGNRTVAHSIHHHALPLGLKHTGEKEGKEKMGKTHIGESRSPTAQDCLTASPILPSGYGTRKPWRWTCLPG